MARKCNRMNRGASRDMDHLLMVLVLLWSSGLQAEGNPSSAQNIKISEGARCETTDKADIVLLVDVSWSIGSRGFSMIKSFISRLVNVFNIRSDRVQIGVTLYSSQTRTEWHLNRHQTKQSLLEATTNLMYAGGDLYTHTYTGTALNHILDINFKPTVGMRADAKKIAVLLTEGKSRDDIVAPSKDLKDTGIELFVIGMRVASKDELRTTASDPKEQHMYFVKDFAFLLDLVDNITINICNSIISLDSVRLVNGTSLCSGRLEVRSNQSDPSWTSVCEADFDQQDAEVTCRQLGCGAPSVLQGELYGNVEAPLWTREFQCAGNESALLECRSSDAVRNSCSPGKSVGLTCSEPVRLVGEASRCAGTLEMKHQGNWRPAYAPAWTLKEAAVACRELHCGSAVSTETRHRSSYKSVWWIQTACVQSGYVLRECVSARSLSSVLQVICSDLLLQPIICLFTDLLVQPIISLFTDLLVQPIISVSSMDGVSQAQQQGLQVSWGSSFTISCSIQPQYPGGSFQLSFTSFNTTRNYIQPAVNHSTHFLFAAADSTHRGNYTCVYYVYVFSHNFSSESWPLSVTVSDPTVFIIRLVILLPSLLFFFTIICFAQKTTRGQQPGPQENTEPDFADCEIIMREGSAAADSLHRTDLHADGLQRVVNTLPWRPTNSHCEESAVSPPAVDPIGIRAVTLTIPERPQEGLGTVVGPGVLVFVEGGELKSDVGTQGVSCRNMKTHSVNGSSQNFKRELSAAERFYFPDRPGYLKVFLAVSPSCSFVTHLLPHRLDEAYLDSRPLSQGVDGVHPTLHVLVLLMELAAVHWLGKPSAAAEQRSQEEGECDQLEQRMNRGASRDMDHLLMVLVLLWSSGLQAEGNPSSAQNIKISEGARCETTDKADIVLLVDVSWSIGSRGFSMIKSFISRLVNVFNIRSDRVQIGVTLYSSQTRTEWHLNRHQTKPSLLEATTNLPYIGGSTDTGTALNHILDINFKPTVGMRADAKKMAVLLTGEESRDDIVAPSKDLKDTGIELFVIGVGEASKDELRTMASDPREQHMYFVKDFAFLLDLVDNVTINICNSIISLDSVRLVNGTSLCSGRLEVRSNQSDPSWTSVCEADFDQQDAEVTCRQLGCGAPSVLQGALYGHVEAPVWTREFQCAGNESALLECRSSDAVRNSCSPGKSVGLTCSEPVRLVGEASRCAGTLEMKHQGNWRPAYAPAWTLKEAAVACRELHCGSAVSTETRHRSSYKSVWWIQTACVQSGYVLRECVSARSLSSVLQVICLDLLVQPIISVSSMDGVSQAQQQGLQVSWGSSFTISCSIQPQYPGGSFQLSFTSFNTTRNYIQPAVNHSTHFLFAAADSTHRGNYTCVYYVYVFSHNFSSESWPLSVTVSDPTVFIIRLVILLPSLLFFFTIICFAQKTTRGQQPGPQENTEPDF
ncbi:uncharacterized protein LOC113135819 [Mastacembelus armatus]|uniref:uncharacterized protein LOC113135819 n=1 Tax=Mastacembelus armatus TaxID=205130 RepID=UPI000E456541|nr:uncharacterized protein LOC113135819 [Mastacembelus armatus]